MVFIRNIIKECENMDENEWICLCCRSGDEYTIRGKDKVRVENADLVITRFNGDTVYREFYVDSAEVESIIIQKMR